MKKIVFLILTTIAFCSCDPLVYMEANIENLTPQSLSISFVSYNPGLSKTLQADPNQTVLFEIYDGYGTYVEPNFRDYDSVIIKSQTGEILKIYKQNSAGKNIYKINEHWKVAELSNRFFKFKYEIKDEDIE